MYNLKEELIEKLRNGKILVKNVDYPCKESLLIQEIFNKTFKGDVYLRGDGKYYTINLKTRRWTANVFPTTCSLPVVDSTDFIQSEKVENYEIY